MSHTPGPWKLDCPLTDPLLHDVCIGYEVPGQGSPIVLASIYYDEERGECPTLQEANANARLMAAAPDLLAACKAVVDYDIPGRDAGSLMQQLRAAIAKAETPEAQLTEQP